MIYFSRIANRKRPEFLAEKLIKMQSSTNNTFARPTLTDSTIKEPEVESQVKQSHIDSAKFATKII
jgi:hypothetical protein